MKNRFSECSLVSRTKDTSTKSADGFRDLDRGVNYDADGKPVKRGEPLRGQIIKKK